MPGISTFFHGVSIDALDRIAFRVGVISILQLISIIGLVFVCRLFNNIFFLVYGCMGVDVNFCSVGWASLFPCGGF